MKASGRTERTEEEGESEVKGGEAHNSDERSDLIRLRGTSSHLLLTQRSLANLPDMGSLLSLASVLRGRLVVF